MGYCNYGYGGYNQCCSYGYSCNRGSSGYAIVLVLFILLVIIGLAAFN